MERTKRANQKSFGDSVCNILKLDSSKISSVTIKIQPNDVVKITTEQNLYEDEAKEILKLLKYYELVKI